MEPVEVRIRLLISRISAINLVEQVFTADIKMEASWIDKDLAGIKGITIDEEKMNDGDNWTKGDLYYKKIDESNCEKDKILDQIINQRHFAPMLKFRNALDFKEGSKKEWGRVFPEKECSVIVYRMDATVTFHQSIPLHYFPFDGLWTNCPKLSIEIVSELPVRLFFFVFLMFLY